MPIRINLLAEAQAEEELRRKDPVKRAFMGASTIVCLVLLWCGFKQFEIISASSEYEGFASQWAEIETDHKAAVRRLTSLKDTENRLDSLENLRTNRFLWGTALNSVQQTLDGVTNIQVVLLRSEQTFVVDEGTPNRTNDTVIIRGKPATSTESMSLYLEAVDFSNPPGAQVNKFKKAISLVPYFQQNLKQTNGVLLTSLSPPHLEGGRGRPFVKFTVECVYPEKVR